MNRLSLATHLLALFSTLPGNAMAGESEIPWGDVNLRIPSPDGFARIDGIDETFDEVQASFFPPSNQLLAMFASDADVEALRRGEVPEMARSMNIQGLVQFISANVSTKDFESLKDEVREQHADAKMDYDSIINAVEKSGGAKLEEVLGEESSVEIGSLTPLGIFDEDENSASFAMTFKVEIDAGGETEAGMMLATGSFVRLHGKVVNIYCNADGTSAEDLKFAKDSILDWKTKILAANEDLKSVMAAKPETKFGTGGGLDSLLKPGLIGGIVGGLVALIFALSKRKKG